MNAMDASEADELAGLVEATARRDERAFEELYRRTSPRLFGVCLRMLRDRAEAEDVLQEAYTAIWRRADSFDPAKARAVTWLVTLTRNRAIDRLRQRPASTLDDSALADIADSGQGPVDHAATSQQRRRLEQCLDELEPPQRTAIREAFFSGATYNDLAERCRVPLGTMKSWIRRSLMRLKTCLER